MSAQNSKNLALAIPLLTAFILLREASGTTEVLVASVAAIATTGFVYLAAYFVWSPLLKKAGFWWSSILLGGAIVVVGLTGIIVGSKLETAGSMWRLPLSATMTGLLFSWALAALHRAHEKRA